MLNILIKRGADLNIRADTGASALHYAVTRGNGENIRLLLEHGTDINAQDRHGWTALRCAVHGNQLELVRLLLKYGADKEIRGDQNLTPLLLAAKLGFVDIFKALARDGANIDAKLPSGEIAEDLARSDRHPEIVTFLADYRRGLKERQKSSTAQF